MDMMDEVDEVELANMLSLGIFIFLREVSLHIY